MTGDVAGDRVELRGVDGQPVLGADGGPVIVPVGPDGAFTFPAVVDGGNDVELLPGPGKQDVAGESTVAVTVDVTAGAVTVAPDRQAETAAAPTTPPTLTPSLSRTASAVRSATAPRAVETSPPLAATGWNPAPAALLGALPVAVGATAVALPGAARRR